MIGDAFVFDGVAHMFNFDAKNPLGRPGEMFSQHIYAFHQALTPEGQTVLPPRSSSGSGRSRTSGAWCTTSRTRTCCARCRYR